VAIIATVGIWHLRNQHQPVQPGTQQPVITRVEEPKTPSVVEEVSTAENQPEQQPTVQPEPKPKAQQPKPNPARALNNKVELIAQAKPQVKVKTQAQVLPELSASDEELALAALEKFATTLNKGMDQLDDAGEKIDNINNTIKQYL